MPVGLIVATKSWPCSVKAADKAAIDNMDAHSAVERLAVTVQIWPDWQALPTRWRALCTVGTDRDRPLCPMGSYGVVLIRIARMARSSWSGWSL